jgi:D-glycero-D-manno-heptose 1,7-bisphosphate phosphatase
MITLHELPPPTGPLAGGALFLDRDGTLNFDRHYVFDPAGIELIPGVAGALSAARALGLRLFLHTNQSGIARGLFQLADVDRCNARLEELLGLPRPVFDAVCVAPEGPADPQVYRKPSPRFIQECVTRHRLAPERCWMVGDRESDLEAGRLAGIGTAAVCTGKHDAAAWRQLLPAGTPVWPSLTELVAALAAGAGRHNA